MKQTIPCQLVSINRVTFFKRDELTTDLICCEISANGVHWTYHEEMTDWTQLTTELQALPGFAANWFERVSQPPFAASKFVAFQRPAT